ncbi:hypothetical protein C4D60_Mb10t06970 [Musa balbisiana]|uniref:Uncharacterized protein n=1 Tax=Musa balbisiana TaxID=52838 RepID=A0A4S8IW34_MUSBA|nr:hypothetical protein C4D60_Mb10t06970 [Musa balbisiana]
MRYVRGIQLNRVTSSAASIYGRPVVGDLLRDPGPGVPSCLFGQGFGRGFPSVAVADCAFWEDASGLCRTCLTSSRRRPTGGGLQSLGLGALDNSFLECGSGIPVVKNFAHVIHGKVVSVKIFVNGAAVDRIPPREGSSNTLLMSPTQTGKPNSTGVLDIETGRFIDDWDFKKDGLSSAGPLTWPGCPWFCHHRMLSPTCFLCALDPGKGGKREEASAAVLFPHGKVNLVG